MKLRQLLLLPALFALVFGLAACGSSKKTTSTTASTPSTATTKAVGAPGASVSFVTPKNGSTTPSTVKVKVTVKKFKINAAAVGKAAVQGQGHLHFSMDNGKFDTPKYSGANGKLAQQLGVAGKYSPSVTPTITYTGIPPGKHTLIVYLANNDHTPTGVQATETITVK
jgi:hypothetical protein